jgi:hypothetical protein
MALIAGPFFCWLDATGPAPRLIVSLRQTPARPVSSGLSRQISTPQLMVRGFSLIAQNKIVVPG